MNLTYATCFAHIDHRVSEMLPCRIASETVPVVRSELRPHLRVLERGRILNRDRLFKGQVEYTQ